MPKDVLLYNDIYSYTAADFVRAVDELQDGDDLVVRINSRGGDVDAMWCMLAKMGEYPGNKIVKVDGKAHSSAAFYLCYADNAEGLDVSDYLLHRGAYWWEQDYPSMMTPEAKANLTRYNNHLRKAFEAKVNVPEFESITGVTVAALFSLDSRIEVKLTAQQAKRVGLIDKIVKLTPAKKQEITAMAQTIGAPLYERVAAFNEGTPPKNQNTRKMDLIELKAQHPDVYAAAIKEATELEQKRIAGWKAWESVDAKAVEAGIASGKEISNSEISAFTAKAVTAKATPPAAEAEKAEDADKTVEALTKEAPKPIATGDAPTAKTKDEEEVQAFKSELQKELEKRFPKTATK